jgi:hypothetical protein
MAKMLVFLVISFAICWLPIQLFHLIMWLCDSCRTFSNQFESNLYYGTFCLFHFLSMAHTLIDPIIYSFMSHNFKVSINTNRKLHIIAFEWVWSIEEHNLWINCGNLYVIYYMVYLYLSLMNVKQLGPHTLADIQW